MENDQEELQLLPTQNTRASYARATTWPSDSMRFQSETVQYPIEAAGPSLDLQLSISLQPIMSPPDHYMLAEQLGCSDSINDNRYVTDQIQIAGMEKAYAERVREMTKREMEMAQSEFTRARHMWERAREEVERADKMKERATRRIDSSCLEITCQSCRQKFRS